MEPSAFGLAVAMSEVGLYDWGDFLEKLVDLGFEDLDAEDVLDFKIHGFDRLLRKRRVRR